MAVVKLQREAKERLEMPVEFADDPASATVEFGFTDTDSSDARPGTGGAAGWISGTWDPNGDTGTGVGPFGRVAVTPLIGDGTLDLDVGKWNAWSRVVLGTEVAVDKCGQVQIA